MSHHRQNPHHHLQHVPVGGGVADHNNGGDLHHRKIRRALVIDDDNCSVEGVGCSTSSHHHFVVPPAKRRAKPTTEVRPIIGGSCGGGGGFPTTPSSRCKKEEEVDVRQVEVGTTKKFCPTQLKQDEDDEVEDEVEDEDLESPAAVAVAVAVTTSTTKTTLIGGSASSTKDQKGKAANKSQGTDAAAAVKDDAAASSDAEEDDDGAAAATSQDYYFDSYAHHAIHEEMLKDHVRTQTYQMAISQNAHLFRDKIVLDVGCGTAILSLFCAQAGAKHVYAVDCSSILKQARKIVQANGYADKITLIQGKMEDIDLPVDQVDIIVSEWMGYFLLYESMLDTVIYARDKWLVPGGKIFPDKAVMYVSAMEDESVRRERIDFWDDVYGFDMSTIKEIALREPVVDVVDPKALVTDAVPILHLDILTCTKEDLSFTTHFKLQARRNDFIHGLVAYFECAFTQIHKPIGFSTAPFCRYTHWKQTIFYVPDTITICAGETLHGQINCRPNHRNKRDLDIEIGFQFHGKHSTINTTVKYRLR